MVTVTFLIGVVNWPNGNCRCWFKII